MRDAWTKIASSFVEAWRYFTVAAPACHATSSGHSALTRCIQIIERLDSGDVAGALLTFCLLLANLALMVEAGLAALRHGCQVLVRKER